LDDFHERPLRLVAVLPSLNVPVALNFKAVPAAIWALAGFTTIETNLTFDTVKDVEPVTEPNVAEIAVVPAATLLTRPLLLIVAVAALDELHKTDSVTS
jgi:hypothetical protein